MKLIETIPSYIEQLTAEESHRVREGQPQISLEEVMNLAKKKKIKSFSQRQLFDLSQEAENAFRVYLSQIDVELFEIYNKLKKGEVRGVVAERQWSELRRKADDTEFKRRFIESRLAINRETEDHFIYGAIREINEKRINDRINNIGSCGPNKEYAEKVFKTAETLKINASGILFPTILEDYIAAAFGSSSQLDILYYFCTRQTHDAGIPSITSHLNPTTKTTLNGNTEERTGKRYRFQLDEISAVYNYIIKMGGNINQRILVADCDIQRFPKKFFESLNQSLARYIESVKDYVSRIPVERQSDFYRQIGFDENQYAAIFGSVLENNGAFVSKEQISSLRQRFARNAIIIRDWDDDSTNRFTAASVARTIIEGKTLQKQEANFILISFATNESQGRLYNLYGLKKVPFLSIDDGFERDYFQR